MRELTRRFFAGRVGEELSVSLLTGLRGAGARLSALRRFVGDGILSIMTITRLGQYHLKLMVSMDDVANVLWKFGLSLAYVVTLCLLT